MAIPAIENQHSWFAIDDKCIGVIGRVTTFYREEPRSINCPLRNLISEYC